mmetsp:Transcript_37042/g.41378  ORF Transcript_37042/g.41378 Transcript_37042/m.41378 type:complete len:91 (+) Transcript_37042:1020-1292(+)
MKGNSEMIGGAIQISQPFQSVVGVDVDVDVDGVLVVVGVAHDNVEMDWIQGVPQQGIHEGSEGNFGILPITQHDEIHEAAHFVVVVVACC